VRLGGIARGLAAALLVLGAAYAGYWHYVAGRLEAGIADWVRQQQDLGNEIRFAEGEIGGFPFFFRRDFGAASLKSAGSAPVELAAAALVAEMRPWDLNKVVFSARAAALTGGEGSYRAAEIGGSVDIPAAPPADYRQPWLGFDVTLLEVTLPAGRRALTAEPVAKLAAQGAVMGPVPQAGDLRTALAGWAAAGGVLELKGFAFAQAPLELAGEGTLALDDALQPLGALTIRAQGLPETIVLLERDGLMDAQSARTATLMANGLAKADDAGRPTVAVSLSLQDGYLWLGPVRLAPLPPIGW
jgi:hypothetical protein